jgi:hypothetical protein
MVEQTMLFVTRVNWETEEYLRFGNTCSKLLENRGSSLVRNNAMMSILTITAI